LPVDIGRFGELLALAAKHFALHWSPAMTDETWVTRAANANLNRKVNEIMLAAVATNDLVCRDSIAVALLEAINQCQDGNGMISAPELHRIAERMMEVNQ